MEAVIIETLENALAGRLVGIYLFGSQTQDRARPSSDVDIAVVLDGPWDPLERLSLKEDLGSALQREVDLVDLSQASPILWMQVLKSGRRLKANRPDQLDWMEAQMFSRYADLKRVRAPAEQSLLESIERG